MSDKFCCRIPNFRITIRSILKKVSIWYYRKWIGGYAISAALLGRTRIKLVLTVPVSYANSILAKMMLVTWKLRKNHYTCVICGMFWPKGGIHQKLGHSHRLWLVTLNGTSWKGQILDWNVKDSKVLLKL